MRKGRGTITNDTLKFSKVVEFESSCIEICFSYIYLIIDEKDNLSIKESTKKITKLIVSATRRRRYIKIPLCLSAPVQDRLL